MPHKLLIDKEI